jgi:hypothetical protein
LSELDAIDFTSIVFFRSLARPRRRGKPMQRLLQYVFARIRWQSAAQEHPQ